MRVHNLNTRMNNGYREDATLEKYEIEAFSDADEVWYEYEYGSYEGYGYALLRKGDYYDLYDMGHCSCYGPTDKYTGFKSTKSLAELKESFGINQEYYNLVSHLIASAEGL